MMGKINKRISLKRSAALLTASLALAGAAAVGATTTASASEYTGSCSEGICTIYKDGKQIGICTESGRCSWFEIK